MNRILFRFIKISQINIKRDLKIIYATLIDPGLDNWHKKSFLFFLPYKKFLKKYLEEKNEQDIIIDIGCGIGEIHLKHKYNLFLLDNSFSCLRAASRIIGNNHKSILCDFFEETYSKKLDFNIKNNNKSLVMAINVLHKHPSNFKKILNFAEINYFKKLIFDVPKNKLISNYQKFLPKDYELEKIYDGKERKIFQVKINYN